MKTLRLSIFTILVIVSALSQASFSGPKIRTPRDGATVNGRNVVISGESDSDVVKVSGFLGVDAAFRQQVPVKDGRWSMSRPMTSGNYQIKAEDKDGSTVINIRVNGRGGENPGGGSLSFTSPRDGSTVRNANVVFSGRSDGNVSLTVYEGSRRVYSGQPTVRNGRWAATVKLNDGAHSAKISQGRKSASINFWVGQDGTPSGGGSTGGNVDVNVSSPRDGASVKGPRVTVSGTSNAKSVGVYIYNGRKRVFDSSTKVNRGRWSFGITLQNGTYRVEVTAGTKKSSSTFTVGN